MSEFIAACKTGNIEAIKTLVKENKKNINSSGLTIACYYGHIEIVKYLIKKGADVNSKNKHGLTALHAACAQGNEELAEFLIFNKAKVEVFDNNGKTPLDWTNDEKILSMLLKHKYIQKYSDKKRKKN